MKITVIAEGSVDGQFLSFNVAERFTDLGHPAQEVASYGHELVQQLAAYFGDPDVVAPNSILPRWERVAGRARREGKPS